MKTSIRSPFGWIMVIILPVISSAQENPYRFERPLSVSEYFSPRSNGAGANNHGEITLAIFFKSEINCKYHWEWVNFLKKPNGFFIARKCRAKILDIV